MIHPDAHSRVSRADLTSQLALSSLVWRAFAPTAAFAVLATNAWRLIVLAGHHQTVSFSGSDLSGVLFLLAAYVYRGPSTLWWRVCVPMGLFLLYAPIAYWELTELLEPSGLVRASIIPGLAFLCGALLAAVIETRAKANDSESEIAPLISRGIEATKNLKLMESEMKDLIVQLLQMRVSLSSGSAASHDRPQIKPWVGSGQGKLGVSSRPVEREFKISRRETVVLPSEVVSYQAMLALIVETLDAARAKYASRPGVRLILSAPAEERLPFAVRGEAETLKRVIDGLVENGVQSLGGSDGVVRVIVRPGLRFVELAIEDNGRGLSEEALQKLEAKGHLRRSTTGLGLMEVRDAVVRMGWRMDSRARLGVGCRVSIELPRVDQLAWNAPLRNSRDLSSQHA